MTGSCPPGQARADLVQRFIECLPLSSGGAFRLMPWQAETVAEFYGRVTQEEPGRWIRQYQYLYLEIPKKNGKSELAAALGLYHTFCDGEVNGEVYICAADKPNAGIVFDAAAHMARHTPALKKRCRMIDSSRMLIDTVSNTKMKVLSAEAYSKHGYKPSCVIFDELHAQRSRELWDVMTFGAGAARAEPVWIVLTTAGDDPDRQTIGWEVHEKARNILRYRAGERGEGLFDDPLWLPVLYGIGDDPDKTEAVDIYDEAVWRACNPSIGVTIPLRVVRAEARAARQSEASERLFRWLRLNQWICVKSVGWIPLTIYDKTQWNGNPEALRGLTCYGGVDLSSTTDLSAFALLFPPQKGLATWVALLHGWTPANNLEAREKRDHAPYRDWIRAGFLRACDGDMMDYEDICQVIADAAAQYDLRIVGFDPYLSRTLTQRLQQALAPQGTQVVEIPQNVRTMGPVMADMERLIRGREMLHVHNTAARWCFGNVRCCQDGNGNLKPMKNRSTGRIDLTVAWIIALAAAQLEQAPTLADELAAGSWTM